MKIGSEFSISPFDLIGKKKNKTGLMLRSGSDSIIAIIKEFNIKKILIPTYICPSVYETLKKQKVEIIQYSIKKNFSTDIQTLITADALLIVHYFGWPNKSFEEISKWCKEKDIKLIEDRVQAPFTEIPQLGDASFNSLRKYMGIPDGSQLNLKISSKLKKDNFFGYLRLINGILRPYFWNLTRKINTKLENYLKNSHKPKLSSWISKRIFERQDLNIIKQKRRENAKYILNNIKKIKDVKLIYNQLNPKVVPIGIPIICKNREDIKKKLILNNIYPPIHWTLDNQTSSKAEIEISNNILTIPIDQRYTQKDMKEIIKCLL